MKRFFAILALVGPLMQFAAAFVASSAVNYDRPDTNDSIPVPLYLEPGGFAFAVWPVIFIAFSLLGIYQLKPSRLEDQRFIKARPFIFLSGFANTVWFYGDVNGDLLICTIAFITMLLCLLKLNDIFELGSPSQSINERWFVKFPISLFFGWITVAFPIGITLWLITDFGITGREFLTPQIWSIIIIAIALSIFGILYWKRKVSTVFVVVGIWGLFWIFFKNLNVKEGLAYAALVACVLLAIEIIIAKFKLRHLASDT